MKRHIFPANAAAFAICLIALPVLAQSPTDVDSTAVPPGRTLSASALDAKTSGATVRASQLIGRNIQNGQGKSVGEISDIVLDAATSRIRYVAVTYGGFMGVGNKMFALPFEAFKVVQNPADPGDAGDYVLVLNVTQAQLKGAVGFDQDHWPNMADDNLDRELRKRYGVGVDVDSNGVNVDVIRKK